MFPSMEDEPINPVVNKIEDTENKDLMIGVEATTENFQIQTKL